MQDLIMISGPTHHPLLPSDGVLDTSTYSILDCLINNSCSTGVLLPPQFLITCYLVPLYSSDLY